MISLLVVFVVYLGLPLRVLGFLMKVRCFHHFKCATNDTVNTIFGDGDTAGCCATSIKWKLCLEACRREAKEFTQSCATSSVQIFLGNRRGSGFGAMTCSTLNPERFGHPDLQAQFNLNWHPGPAVFPNPHETPCTPAVQPEPLAPPLRAPPLLLGPSGHRFPKT